MTVEQTAPLRVYEAVARALVADGVEAVFGLMGDDTAAMVVAIEGSGIAYHGARHENQAVAMADGYARVTRRVGIAPVPGGPGFSNALTAINTARRASSGIVVIVGAGRSGEDDHDDAVVRAGSRVGWLKHLPQLAVCESIGIAALRPATAEDAVRDTRRAFARARRGETVVLILGRDVLGQEIDGGAVARFAVPATGPGPAPSHADVVAFADLLQETWAVSRPVILAGRGALASDAGPALRRLGELTGAVLATTLRAPALFAGDPFAIGMSGTYATSIGSELLLQADCVLAFGASLNKFTTHEHTLFPQALVVHVDTDSGAIGRFVDAGLAIQADARLAAEAVVAELERREHTTSGFRTPELATRIAAFRPSDEVRDQSTPDLIDARTLMLELDRILPADRVLTIDAGHHSRFSIRYLRVERPENFVQSVDGGSIGLGIGTAIGAAVGRPEATVVLGVGDAGLLMSIGDLETAVRLNLPLIVIVSNDHALGSEVKVLSELGLPTDLAKIPAPSFAAVATALGAEGHTVTSVADLHRIADRLRVRPAGLLLLDCRVNPEVMIGF